MASDILKNVAKYEGWLIVGNTLGLRGDPSKVSGIKHHSALYDLPLF